MGIKDEMGQYEKMKIEYGDFFDRCFPRTYGYFTKKQLKKLYDEEPIDCFDCFIKEEVPFFSFLITQYYKNRKSSKLQLIALADEKLLDHFDQLILEYITTKNSDVYAEAKEIYIYFLETCVLKLCLGEQPR